MMSNLTENALNKKPGLSPIWSPTMTWIWGFVIFSLFVIFQIVGLAVAAKSQGVLSQLVDLFGSGDSESLQAFQCEHDLVWPSALSSALLGTWLILFIIRAKRGLSIKDYLNLHNVDLRVWGIWIGIMLGVSFLLESLSQHIDALQSPFMEQVVFGSKNIPMLFISVGILVPIVEEFIFRGFLYKGLERSILGPHGTIWLTSAIFALIHMQYNWEIILLIFPMSLMLGYSRMYSGSLLVPIALHAINNCMALIWVLNSGGRF